MVMISALSERVTASWCEYIVSISSLVLWLWRNFTVGNKNKCVSYWWSTWLCLDLARKVYSHNEI